MIHVPDMTAARCDRGLGCCDHPDHVDITCPTCDGIAEPLQVGAWSPPEYAECPRCENHGTVIACRHCGTVDSMAERGPRDCDDWDGETVAAAYDHDTKTRRM